MSTITIGFIGLGLIGGSIAKSLKKFHPGLPYPGILSHGKPLSAGSFRAIIDEALTKAGRAFRYL